MPLSISKIGPYLDVGKSPATLDEYAFVMNEYSTIFEFNDGRMLGVAKLIPELLLGDEKSKFAEKGLEGLSPNRVAHLQTTLNNLQMSYADKNVVTYQFYLDDTQGRGLARIFWQAQDAFLKERRANPSGRILVHSGQSNNRAPLFLIFQLMLTGLSFADALAFLKSKRATIDIKDDFADQVRLIFHEVEKI